MAARARPRVAVVGAGTLGCFIGAHLAKRAEVTLIGKEPLISAIADHGLIAVDGDKTTHRVEPRELTLDVEVSRISGADIVLVTPNALETAQTGALIAPYLTSDSVVVSCQTGLDNARQIDDAITGVFPSRADRPLIVASTVGYNVTRADTTVVQQSAGALHMSDHPRAAVLGELAARGNMRVVTHGDMTPVLWTKLMLSLNNAINALSGLTIAEQLHKRGYREVLAMCMEEALLVARAGGINPARVTPLPVGLMPKALRAPNVLFYSMLGRHLSISPQARSSMAFDLDHGKPTEVEHIQGAVSRLGVAYGLPTPACTALTTLMREATPGRTISSSQMREIVSR